MLAKHILLVDQWSVIAPIEIEVEDVDGIRDAGARANVASGKLDDDTSDGWGRDEGGLMIQLVEVRIDICAVLR